MLKKAFTLAALLMLSACAGKPVPLGQTGAVSVYQGDTLPAPSAVDSLTGTSDYVLGPADKLIIDVFGIPEMSGREVQIDSAGRIAFPLAGSMQIAGKTPDEATALIRDRLRAASVRDPQVTLTLKENASRTVTVDGEVNLPGIYPVTGRITLMRSVAMARGLNENAKADDVVVFRTVKGQRLAALYNLQAIRRGNYQDPEIYANDVLIVGESRARRLFKDWLQVIPLLTTPLIVALQNI